MFRFLQGGSTPAEQDVEMAVDRTLPACNATEPSTHTSYPTVTPTVPRQDVESGTLAFIEKQQTVIDACMVQVSS
jgi:hypothetical protein